MMYGQTESEASGQASDDACVQKSVPSQPPDTLGSERHSHAASLVQLGPSVHFLIAVEEVCSRLAFETQCARAGLSSVETCETDIDFIRVMDDFQTRDDGYDHLVVILGQQSWLSLMQSFVACPRPFHLIDASEECVYENGVKLLASCTDREFSDTVKGCLGLGDAVKPLSELATASRASTRASDSCDCSPAAGEP